MKSISRNLSCFAMAVLALILATAASPVPGQDYGNAKIKSKTEQKDKERGICSYGNWSDDDRASFNELRESTVSATDSLSVDGRPNGGISVRGEDRSDVLVRACVHAWGKTDEAARSVAANVRINTGSTIRAENLAGDRNWSVSYDISVPRSTNLTLTSHNGGITVRGAEGTISFETTNGGVSLIGVAGTVTGRTSNGGISVVLSGNSWKGSGLDVETTNGGVSISVPENFSAHVEAGTTNGGFSSDLPGLQPEKSDDDFRSHRTMVNVDLNGGGPTVRIMTTNGGIRISRAGGDREKRMM